MSIRRYISRQLSSKIARSILSLKYKENHFYKLIFGPMRGSRMIYRNDMNFHTMMGLWEMDSISIMLRLFRHFNLNGKKLVIADVGANIGYYCMFFSKYLAPDSKIFAFEPSTSILPVLKKNMEANNYGNVTLVEKACSNHSGTEEFFIGTNHHQSSLVGEFANNNVAGTRTSVSTTTLDDFFANNNDHQYPDIIKMDIEGGGVYALKGCIQCIENKRPFILIECHTPDEDQAVIELLENENYDALRVDTDKWVLNKKADYKDKEGVWGTMLLIPCEKRNGFSE